MIRVMRWKPASMHCQANCQFNLARTLKELKLF